MTYNGKSFLINFTVYGRMTVVT